MAHQIVEAHFINRSFEHSKGPNPELLELWKIRRRIIVEKMIDSKAVHEFHLFDIPSNVIRSHDKMNLLSMPLHQREETFVEDFIYFCQGSNMPTILCKAVIDDEGREKFVISHSPLGEENLKRWIQDCINMAGDYFELARTLNELRNDRARGTIVYTFCVLVKKFIQANVLSELEKIEMQQGKNVLSLQLKCVSLHRIVQPLKEIAVKIKHEEIIGGSLITFLTAKSEDDQCYPIRDLLLEIVGICLQHYCRFLFEWMTLHTTNTDVAYEFFIWNIEQLSHFISPNDFLAGLMSSFLSSWELSGLLNNFENRYVFVEQLCPSMFEEVSKEIVKIGLYLRTIDGSKLKSKKIVDEVLRFQQDMWTLGYRDKTPAQICHFIREAHKRCSALILQHFVEQFNIREFAIRLPNYFLGMGSTLIHDFVALFLARGHKEMSVDELKSPDNFNLRGLFIDAIDGGRLSKDKFKRVFELKMSKIVPNGSTSHNENNKENNNSRNKSDSSSFTFDHNNKGKAGDIDEEQDGDEEVLQLDFHNDKENNEAYKAYCLSFPFKIAEPYKRLFQHRFQVLRASHLIHQKLLLNRSFMPGRLELLTIHRIIRFLNAYTDYLFDRAVREPYRLLPTSINTAKNLDELIFAQFDGFVSVVAERSAVGEQSATFRRPMVAFLDAISDYATDKLTYAEFEDKASLKIGRFKRVMRDGNRRAGDFLDMKQILFGTNFSSIGLAARGEPVWEMLLRKGP